MSVIKRPASPYYYADFWIENHRVYRSTKVTTRREALAVEKQFRQEELKRIKSGDAERLTVDQAFGRFWLEVGCKHPDRKQRKDTERYIAQILAVVDPHKLIEDVSDADVNDFAQARSRAAVDPKRKKRAGPGHIATNRAIAVWRQMHRRASKSWKQKVQTIDWSEHLNKERQRMSYLEFDQVRVLLASLPDYLQIAVEWSVAAGTRRSATFGLEWTNVFIDRSYAIVREKGKPEFKVWLSPQLIDILNRARVIGHPPAMRKRGSVTQQETRQKEAERFVFCSRNWKKLWAAALVKAGISDFRWHDLRHTFATWLRQNDTPLEVVQRALGHAQITTTMRYAHVADREVQTALQKVPSFSPSETAVVPIQQGKSKG